MVATMCSMFTMLVVLVLPCCAQISTLGRVHIDSVVQSPVFKYDSLSNIKFYDKSSGSLLKDDIFCKDNKMATESLSHLIGQRLYFYGDTAEISKTSLLSFYKLNNGKHKKKNPFIYFPYTDFLNKYFTIVSITKKYGFYEFKLFLENENDTLYCRMYHVRNDFWTVQGYYEKAKKDFLHKKFVLKERQLYINKEKCLYRLSDNKCGEDLPINSVWECKDVTLKGYDNSWNYSNVILVFTNKEYGDYYMYLDGKNRKTLDIFMTKEKFDSLMENKLSKYDIKGKDLVYINKFGVILYKLSDGQRFEGKIPINTEFHCTDISFYKNNLESPMFILHNDTFGDFYTFENGLNNFFQTKEEYLQDKKKNEQRREKILAKYGRFNGQTILDGKVKIGFTKEMCVEAWGKPNDINKSIGSWGVHEQWCYSFGSYLYFENGKLTAIDN